MFGRGHRVAEDGAGAGGERSAEDEDGHEQEDGGGGGGQTEEAEVHAPRQIPDTEPPHIDVSTERLGNKPGKKQHGKNLHHSLRRLVISDDVRSPMELVFHVEEDDLHRAHVSSKIEEKGGREPRHRGHPHFGLECEEQPQITKSL